MAAVAVHRPVVAHRRVPRRRSLARDREATRRQGDGDAQHAAPRERARLSRVRRDLSGTAHRRAAATAVRTGRGGRPRSGGRAARRPRGRTTSLAPGAARRARPPEAGDRGPPALVRLVRAVGSRRPDPRAVGLRVAFAHGRWDLRSCADLARRGRRGGRRRGGTSRPPLPGGLRPGHRRGHLAMDGPAAEPPAHGARAARAQTLPGRARSRPLRPATSSPPTRRRACTGATPPALRQSRAEPRRSQARHLERAPGGRHRGRRGARDVSRRRFRRRHMGTRRRPREDRTAQRRFQGRRGANSRTKRRCSKRSSARPARA